MRSLILLLLLLVGGVSAQGQDRRNVAILVWPGAELLDFAGPAEVFSAAGRHRLYRVYTVAETKDVVRCQGGVDIQPAYTLEDSPKPDIIVVPGGNMNPVMRNPHVHDWLRRHAPAAEVVLSVCTGSFLLAELGLLDGAAATTHHFGFDRFERDYPRVRLQRTQRFVDNGKIVTAGGVSAGIDGALHVVARLHGPEVARWTAREWMEYHGGPAESAAK
jgi:transcriptional regulator GlxA family with amidase domain